MAIYGIFFSIYLLIKGVKSYLKSKEKVIDVINHKEFLKHSNSIQSFTHTHGGSTHTHTLPLTQESYKRQIVLGFIAGIAPCFLGWSIF
jgi:hypothetical protein